MKFTRYLLLATLLSGCIDLELAHAECVDAGRCSLGEDAGSRDAGGSVDAGLTDAGGVDAGTPDAGDLDAGITDAGPADAGGEDAGVPDAGASDAGSPDAGMDAGPPPCSGSTRPRLACDPPINLGISNGIRFSSLAAYPDGFLAAWTSNQVDLKHVSFDGGVSPLVSRGGVSSGQVIVDSKGTRWALVWLSAGATTASCTTSDAPDAAVQVTAPGPLDIISGAISVDGGVAIAATRGPLSLGAQAHGCPTSLSTLGFPIGPQGISVVATADPLADGFRYVYTGGGDAGSLTQGNLIIAANAAPDAGGFTTTTYYSLTNRPAQNQAVASTDGTQVLVTFDGEGPTLGAYKYSVYGTPADLRGSADQAKVVRTTPAGWWSIGTCGAGCVAQGVTPYDIAEPAVVSFFSDTSALNPRGQYDLACDVPPWTTDHTTMSLAYSGGRIGALITTSFSADLYICDVP